MTSHLGHLETWMDPTLRATGLSDAAAFIFTPWFMIWMFFV